MRVQSRSIATTFWLTVVAVLLSAIALQLTGHASILSSEEEASPRPELSYPDLQSLETSLLTSPQIIDDITNRPLFSESRRPSKKVSAMRSTNAGTAAASLTLVGILSNGPLEMALIRHSERGLMRVKPGQTIDTWRLATIALDRVHLARDDVNLWLKVGSTSSSAK